MDNGFKELARCYRKAKFDGFAPKIHFVPHDSDTLGYDKYREGIYPVEHAMISKPHSMSADLKEEFSNLISHCSSSLYRIEFQRCHKPDCVLCRDHVERDCPLNDFLKRFPNNQLPTPIPMLPVFPPGLFEQRWHRESSSDGRVDSNRILESLMVPRNPAGDQCDRAIHRLAGHFRTFGDLLNSRLPEHSPFYSTDYYRGPTKRYRCVECRLPHVLNSDAAFNRHCCIVHDDQCVRSGPIRMVMDDIESDCDESD